MADQTESIVISVTETGVETVEAALQALGLTAEAAAERLASGFVRSSSNASTAANSINILTAAERAGVENTDAYVAAMARMTAGELSAASAGQTVTKSVTDFGAAANAGRTGATGLAVAHGNVEAAANKAAGGMNNAGAAAKVLGGNIGSLSTLLQGAAAYLSFTAFEHASDSFTAIDNQLKQVTHSTAEYKTAYDSLLATANQSQTSFEANAKLFFNMSNATKDLHASQSDLLTVVNTVSNSLYASGASAAQSTRTIYELSEAFGKGQLSGRQFLAIAINAPGLLTAMATGLGITREALQQMASQANEAGKSTETFAETQAKAAVQQDKVGLAYSKSQLALQNLQTQQAKAKEGYIALLESGEASNLTYGKIVAAQKNLANIDEQLNIKRAESYAQTDQSIVNSAKQTSSSVSLSAETLIKALVAANKSQADLAIAMNGTIHGAFQVLENDWVDYVGKVDSATGANRVIVQTIVLIGSNLQTVIPIVASFAAAFLLSSAINSVKSLGTELSALGGVLKTIDVLAWLNPWTIGFALIGAAIAGVITYFGKWNDIINDAKIIFNGLWVAIQGGAQDAIAALSPIYKFVASTLTDAWNSLKATVASMFGNSIDLGFKFQDVLTLVYGAVKVVGVTIGVLAAGAVIGFTLIIDVVNKVVETIKAVGSAISAVISFVNDLVNGFNRLLGIEKEVAAAVPATGAGAGRAVGGARDGTDFIVGNHGGGTDSQLLQMMVSPGERVVIQTPAQQANDNIPHFRDGGSIGVTGDLSGVNVQFIQSANSSVTGYSPVVQQAVQAIQAASAASSGSATSSIPDAAIAAAVATSTDTGTATDWQAIYETYKKDELSEKVWLNTPYSFVADIQPGVLLPLIDPGHGPNATTPSRSQADDINEMYAVRMGAVPWSLSQDAAYSAQVKVGGVDTRAGGDVAVGLGFSVGGQFRDGGDFMVPGTGGVDSRVIGLQVSPGENVSVRTPGQQQKEANSNDMPPIVFNSTYHVTSPDVAGFRRSAAQLDQEQGQRLRRIANRSRG